MQKKQLYLIDGNSYSYRAYYAIKGLSTSAGQPTNAVFGFVTMLNKLRTEVRPDYLAVCFDLKGPTLRHERFADYKIHRKPMPDDLQSQMPLIKEIISAYGIPIFQLGGYEADDIIATLALKFKNDVDVYIVSQDKDMLQIVDKYVKIYNPQRNEGIIDEQKVLERYNIKPSQITDLLALTGDSSDNIPGVPGIGAKTAAELINTFGSLEKILDNINDISQKKRRDLLKQFSKQACLSKELATVVTDVPVKVSLDRLRGTSEDVPKLEKIFRDLEFKSLYGNLSEDKPQEATDVLIETISKKEQLAELAKSLKKIKELSFHIQNDANNNIAAIEICHRQKHLYRIIINSKITLKDLKAHLEPVFKSDCILKIGFDLKSICVLLEKFGVSLTGPFFDIMVAAYLLEPSAGKRSCSDIANIYLERNINSQVQACEQVCIKDALEEKLEEKNLRQLFEQVEMPLLRVLASMEHVGIRVDKNMLIRLDKQMDKSLEQITGKIYKISGCQFNINSPKQLSEILFDRLKLPVIKKGKSGPSTNVEVLMRLSSEHALPALVLEYREIAKLKSTYVNGMLQLINPHTHRVHTSFNQTATATGRLSSSSPNLQNIPVRSVAGRQIRAAFIACKPGWRLVSADYSQIELRILAHLSADRNLTKAFKQDLDIHSYTASLIFGIDKENITEKMRDLAKRVNFGIIYGMGAYGLARDIGVSHQEAKKFIGEYFNRYQAVKKYMQKQIKQAQMNGYVVTLLNRRRYIPQINSRDSMQRSFAERMAMNAPIQGTAADLIKVAMVDIYRLFKKEKLQARMLLQVHDELVFDVPDNELAKVKQIVKNRMEDVLKLDVPIRVGLKVGPNWRDMA